MSDHFQIVFTGKLLPGFTPDQVRDNASQRLKLSIANQEAMFSGRRAVLKQGLDFLTADTIREEYAKLGMKVHIEPERQQIAAAARAALNDDLNILPPIDDEGAPPAPAAPPPKSKPAGTTSPPPAELASASLEPVGEEIVCPKCNARQPKRTLCRACGTDMPRYIAGLQQAERDARAARVAATADKRGTRISRQEPRPKAERKSEPQVEQPVLLGIDFGGRFSRTRYLVSGFLSLSVFFIAIILTNKTHFAVFLAGLLFVLAQAIRGTVLRLHDMGKTGWLSLLCLIPVLGGLFSLALIFLPGDEVANDYGEAPSPAPLPLQLVSFLVMVVLAGLVTTQMDQFGQQSKSGAGAAYEP